MITFSINYEENLHFSMGRIEACVNTFRHFSYFGQGRKHFFSKNLDFIQNDIKASYFLIICCKIFFLSS